MASGMKFWLRSPDKFSSHIPILIRMFEVTEGPILELGIGIYSTPLLHYLCVSKKRYLISYESNEGWLDTFWVFQNKYHFITPVKDWRTAEIERDWSFALVDHHPVERRKEDIKRLAYCSRFIVVHDTNGRNDSKTGFDEIWPMFKYKYHYGTFQPQTSVISMYEDPRDRLICS